MSSNRRGTQPMKVSSRIKDQGQALGNNRREKGGGRLTENGDEGAATALYNLSTSPIVGSRSVMIDGNAKSTSHPTRFRDSPFIEALSHFSGGTPLIPSGGTPLIPSGGHGGPSGTPPTSGEGPLSAHDFGNVTPGQWEALSNMLRAPTSTCTEPWRTTQAAGSGNHSQQPTFFRGTGLTPFLQNEGEKGSLSNLLLGDRGTPISNNKKITPSMFGGPAAFLDALVGGSGEGNTTPFHSSAEDRESNCGAQCFGTHKLPSSHEMSLSSMMNSWSQKAMVERHSPAWQDINPAQTTSTTPNTLASVVKHRAATSEKDDGSHSLRVERTQGRGPRRSAAGEPHSRSARRRSSTRALSRERLKERTSPNDLNSAHAFLSAVYAEQIKHQNQLPQPWKDMKPTTEEVTDAEGTHVRHIYVPVFVPHPEFFAQWLNEYENQVTRMPFAVDGAIASQANLNTRRISQRNVDDSRGTDSSREDSEGCYNRRRRAVASSYTVSKCNSTTNGQSQEGDSPYVPSPTVYCHFQIPSNKTGLTEAERKKLEAVLSDRYFKRMTRQAAIVRYRQRKKEKKFEKKVRYGCRKSLADQRPRVNGRFTKLKHNESSKKSASETVSIPTSELTSNGEA